MIVNRVVHFMIYIDIPGLRGYYKKCNQTRIIPAFLCVFGTCCSENPLNRLNRDRFVKMTDHFPRKIALGGEVELLLRFSQFQLNAFALDFGRNAQMRQMPQLQQVS